MIDYNINIDSSRNDKMLHNIEQLLLEQNRLLRRMANKDLDSETKEQLVARAKALPKGTLSGKYWLYSETRLRNELKEVL